MTLHLKNVIGRGSFGTVFEGTYQIGNIKKDVAIKKLKSNSNGIPFLMELSIMNTYKHKYINTAYDIILKNDNIYIIQPLANILNLQDYLKFNFIPFKAKMYGIYGLLEGINFLHTRGILHLDIKASNILISKSGIWKITDFTLSSKIGWKITQKPCTITHRPPEIFLGKYILNPKIDSWSLGCTIYYIIYEKLLFNKQRNKNGYMLAINDFCHFAGYNFDCNNYFDSNYNKPNIQINLKSKKYNQVNRWIFKMLNPDPKKRISVVDIIGNKGYLTENLNNNNKLYFNIIKCMGDESFLTKTTTRWIMNKLTNGEYSKPAGIPTYKLLLEEKNILTKMKFKIHL